MSKPCINHAFVLALILAVFLSLSSVSAQVLTVENIEISGDIEDNIIWLNEDLSRIKVEADCKLDGVEVSNPDEFYLEIYPPGSSTPMLTREGLPETFNDPRFFDAYENPDTHPYRVKVICEDGGLTASAEENIYVYELTLDIYKEANEEIEVFQGGEFILKVELELNGKLVTPSHNTFDVYFDDEDDDWQDFEIISDPVLRSNYQEILLYVPLHDDDISVDKHDIKVRAEYSVSGSEATVTDEARNFIWVNNPISVEIRDNKIVCAANEICEKNISAKVIFRAGSIENFDTENVEAVLISKYKYQKVTVDDVYCDEGEDECDIIIIIPSYISSGDYDLFITFGYPSLDNYRYKSQDSIPFESVIELSGEFRNAAGKVVNTEIHLDHVDSGETIIAKTNSNGEYSVEILPGVYNVAFKFSGSVVAKIYNVSITDFDLMSIPGDMIRFDSDHITAGAPSGLNVVKVVVIEFALPLSDGWVYIPYDSKKVNGKEENLRLYRCVDWNFMKSSCSGDWERIPAEVHTIRDALEFETDTSAAFIVGENNWLLFSQLELADLEVNMGESVTVDGAVIDNDDNPVPGASITLSFPEFNISRKAVSSGTGGFSARINAPSSTGNFLLGIDASKDPYSSVNDTRVVRVIRSKALGITGVRDVETISFNESLNLSLSLVNHGQTNFTKPIYLEVNGIPNDWYSLYPSSVDGLSVGESRNILLRVRLTPELCVSGCKKYNLVNFVARSEEITHSVSFSIELIEPVPGSPGSNVTESESGGGLIGFISFPSFSLPSVSSPYISLTIIVILLLLIVNKKKASEGLKKGIYRTHILARSIKKKSSQRKTSNSGFSINSLGDLLPHRKKPFRGDILSPLHSAKSEVTGRGLISGSKASASGIVSLGGKPKSKLKKTVKPVKKPVLKKTVKKKPVKKTAPPEPVRKKSSGRKKKKSRKKKSEQKKFDWDSYWNL